MSDPTHLAWGDLETGGLNGRQPDGSLGMESLPIFEIAIIVTNLALDIIGEPLHIIIHHDEASIERCHPEALAMHQKSGLLDEVRASRITLAEAEQHIMHYLDSLGIKKYDRKARTGVGSGGIVIWCADDQVIQTIAVHIAG